MRLIILAISRKKLVRRVMGLATIAELREPSRKFFETLGSQRSW